MDEGDGRDQMDQFHQNEAISAVADDGFMAEEEDDDYEDLYNDVNVGEGFLQSMKKNDEAGSRNEEKEKVNMEEEDRVEPVLGEAEVSISIPGLVGESVEKEAEAESGGGGSGSGTDVVVASSGYGAQEVKVSDVSQEIPGGIGTGTGGGLRVELGQASNRANDLEAPRGNNISQGLLPPPPVLGNNENLMRPVMGNVNGGIPPGPGSNMVGNGANIAMPGVVGGGTGGGGGGGAFLFVGDLHWWTTDAELEAELCKYGAVKEVKFFDEKASGKSKGYCQVEFYDPVAASACKDALNGYPFNGRPCVVEYASPYSVKRMGEAQVNRTQQAQSVIAQAKRGGPADPPSKPLVANNNNNNNNNAIGGNFQGGENRGFGRGNWGRGNAQGMGGRGPGGPMRNRPNGMGGRAAESSYGEEAASDHQYGEVNHERGARPNPVKEKERASEREWSGSSDRRNREDKDAGYERDIPREKDVGHGYDMPERRHRDDRDTGREREREHHHKDRERSREHVRDRERERERDRHREERERYGGDHRTRHRDEPEHDEEWNRGRSSRGHNKSRLSREDNHRSKSRDTDYGKRRRLTTE
ncbi:RNA-binding (RRM/RBD/RNP motifs) family protein [Arabidopsis thaliana]|uniref:RNA-binding (RRM/RBD/RNP motifs) family protein n=1 Tax=Arabidopsis thaliana TaxID=3702 RepID=F4K4Y6_ARATH|nr:RNA-binding (RRM/RBD/RNP motifs) family protein [Arabidopsis thaliana]AED96666.1 RNA-binding (RRM/RBD/RNP motifs) family protein [Arabidopsis thaliana]|eukprot:NP_001190548.1 RNA-binding (RRM/RBD/RNP motifs) family protein [Arabidopsis thaliana]